MALFTSVVQHCDTCEGIKRGTYNVVTSEGNCKWYQLVRTCEWMYLNLTTIADNTEVTLYQWDGSARDVSTRAQTLHAYLKEGTMVEGTPRLPVVEAYLQRRRGING